VAKIRDPRHFVPVLAGRQPADQVDECQLTFIAHHAVELREVGQEFLVAEAGVVTADREMAGYAGLPQMDGQTSVLRQEELEDEREPHDQWRVGEQPLGDLMRTVADVDNLDAPAVLLQRRCQVPDAQVALILIADQCNIEGTVGRVRRRNQVPGELTRYDSHLVAAWP
jgi:hypothetical protein